MFKEISIFKLNNGISLVLNNTRNFEQNSCFMSFKVGLCDEGPLLGSGIRHLIEHFIVKSFPLRISGETTSDIVYFVIANSCTEQLFKTIIINIRSYFENDLFRQYISKNPRSLDRVKNTISDEIKEHYSKDANNVFEQFMKKCFKGEPYAARVAGNICELKKITKEQILKFYYNFLKLDNMVIYLVGNFNKIKVVELTEENIGDLKKKDSPKNFNIIRNEKNYCENKNSDNNLFLFGLCTYGIAHKINHHTQIIAEFFKQQYMNFFLHHNADILTCGLYLFYEAGIWIILGKKNNIDIKKLCSFTNIIELNQTSFNNSKKNLLLKQENLFNKLNRRIHLLTSWANIATEDSFYDWYYGNIKKTNFNDVIKIYNKFLTSTNYLINI